MNSFKVVPRAAVAALMSRKSGVGSSIVVRIQEYAHASAAESRGRQCQEVAGNAWRVAGGVWGSRERGGGSEERRMQNGVQRREKEGLTTEAGVYIVMT
jgi:hypothetical protein